MIALERIKAFKAVDIDNKEVEVTVDELVSIVADKMAAKQPTQTPAMQPAAAAPMTGALHAEPSAGTPMLIPSYADDRTLAAAAAAPLGVDQYEDQLPENANPAYLRGLMLDGAPVRTTMKQIASVVGGQIGKVKNSGQPEIFTTGVIKLAPGESKTFNGRGGFLYLMPQEHCTGYYNVGIWSSTPKLIEYAGNAITAFLEVTKAHSSIDVTIKNITAEKKTLDVQYIAIGML